MISENLVLDHFADASKMESEPILLASSQPFESKLSV